MKNFVAHAGRIGSFALITLLLTSSAFSQAALRKAMDYDADGKADFVVFRPTNNVWYISNNTGVTATNFGLQAEDFMTPGDYDGDGKGDIAVWRDTTGTFYWLNSSDGTFHAVNWGLTNDEPVARDYDGDGKTDLAVARRSG